MFTGLVQSIGKVVGNKYEENGLHLRVEAPDKILNEISVGDSIALNGVCQTVEKHCAAFFEVFSIPETLKVTNLIFLEVGDLVNLELPLRVSDRLGGHIVQGHIDARAPIIKIHRNYSYWDITIGYNHPGILLKGSIALDGVSLTVQKVDSSDFSVQIIPETLKKTNIRKWEEKREVNIEIDYLVKAVQNK